MTHRILTIALPALSLLGVAQAQTTLSPARLATACTACKADAACNVPRTAGNVGGVLTWLNGERTPAALAWSKAAPQAAVRQAPAYTSYDSLATGKRDSWVLLLADTQDFSKAKIRNWVVDVWGAATAASNAEAVLLAGTYNATNLQNAIGGTSRTTGTVTALDLTYTGQAAMGDAEWLVSPANCQ